ncbi:hypothetical protein [Oligoflexus tunisiensis]|uniref:hypothetical protein n=1 Tax=Oligoflexus tunisiensis TaxID=708132 RepID=UPI00114CD278|nr:hypothetical protein [Oligoflexus tunisiensis]
MRNIHYGLCLLVIVQASCADYQPSQLQTVPLNSRTVFQRKVQVALHEAADALSDSNPLGVQAPGVAAFALQDIVQQTCVNQAGGALITRASSQTNSFAMDSLEKSYQKDVFVNAQVERSYKLVDEDLECARKQPIIEVDLDKDLLNLQLDVKHRREEKTYISELQKPEEDEPAAETESTSTAVPTPPPSRQMTSIISLVEGTRKVTFTAALGEVQDEVSYSKESQGTGTRREIVQSSANVDQELNFTIQSQFTMVDTYNEDDRDLAVGRGPLRKEITTGTVKSILAGEGSVETTFTNLKLEFTQGSCKAVSGTIQSRFLLDGDSTPRKTVDFDVASGSVKVTDTIQREDSNPLLDQADILASMDLQKELCAQDSFLD